MDRTAPHPSILLVDDNPALLQALADATRAAAKTAAFSVETWSPGAEGGASAAFQSKISNRPLLVVTDYDLTARGSTGLFGSSILAWCQRRTIPAGGYSMETDVLSKEPNLFEFRLSGEPAESGPEIAAIAAGFLEIRKGITDDPALLSSSSATALLSKLLGHPEAAAPFSLYASRLASSNSALVDLMRKDRNPPQSERGDVAAYVAGHVLYNAILKYPGPIISRDALCAYLALSTTAGGVVMPLFKDAAYAGPFKELGDHFWLDGVDARLEVLAETHDVEYRGCFDDYRRRTIEAKLGRALDRHDCPRCGGERGGFWCPFTKRPVCERKDCSVASSSLVPQGASLTRVERDFYDEWVPLLGL